MAKKFRLQPGGILFLVAIVILIGALIAVIAVISSSCRADKNAQVTATASPTATATSTATPPPTDDPFATATPAPIDPSGATPDPNSTDDPNASVTPSTTGSTEGSVTIATPPQSTATPAPTAKIYTSPTSAQKKAAKAGYVYKDKVKMRKGPATTYEVVRDAIPKNTAVTLYELQDGWWFLKCGSKYGYIRKDMIKEGEPKTAAVESGDLPNGSFEGTIKTNSVAALRKGPSKSSKAIKEMTNGTKVTVYYKTKDDNGGTWYFIDDGKHEGYVYSSLIKTSKKVPTR